MDSIIKSLAVIIFICVSTSFFGQWPIQICDEPLDPADCIVNETTPDYKTPFYNYMIIRDKFVSGIPKFGKNPNSPNPANKVDLNLDVYLPCNNEASRPVVIVPRASHYTSNAGVTSLGFGGKHRYILRELARRGFVAVTIEYRSYTKISAPNFYVDITPGPGNAIDSCAYNAYLIGETNNTNNFFRCYKCLIESNHSMEAELFKKWMMYINKQDVFAALGYCLEDPSNVGYNVDIDNVFIGGLSNGGQISLTAAYLDEDEYTSTVENQIKSKLGPLDSLGFADRLPENFEFKGAFNFWGSIHDINHIDSEDPPAYLVHGTWDGTVPYQDNYLAFASDDEESHFYSYGSEAIACRLHQQNIDFGLFSMYRVGHGLFPQEDECTPALACGVYWSDHLIKKISNFMRKLVLYNSYPLTIKKINPQNYKCNSAISQTLILDLYESNLTGICIQNPAHIPSNLSELLAYCNCESNMHESGHEKNLEIFNLTDGAFNLHIYPNPSKHILNFKLNTSIEQVRILNIMGQTVLSQYIEGEIGSMGSIAISQLPAGTYVIAIGNRRAKFVKQ